MRGLGTPGHGIVSASARKTETVGQDGSGSVYSASGYCWMFQLLLVSQPNKGHLCSHIFVPLCTCVWKIKFLEEKLVGEKHAYFKF